AFLSADHLTGNRSLPFIQRDAYLETIHQTQFRKAPHEFRELGPDDLAKTLVRPWDLPGKPQQEAGIKPASPLPYDLYADLHINTKGLALKLTAGNAFFGKESAGAPFTVYEGTNHIRSYALVAGDALSDHFEVGKNGYDIRVNGPNGFYRHFKGTQTPAFVAHLAYETENGRPTG